MNDNERIKTFFEELIEAMSDAVDHVKGERNDFVTHNLPPPTRCITDPIERIIADALDCGRVIFVHDSDPGSDTKNLDFYIPSEDIYIEVKQGHSLRIAEQMSRADNVIAIQGRKAAEFFSTLCKRQPKR